MTETPYEHKEGQGFNAAVSQALTQDALDATAREGNIPSDSFRYDVAHKYAQIAPDYETAPDVKQTNPKDALGALKLPLSLWPPTATAMGSVAMADGMLKYGRANFRAIGIRASIYVDAAFRHIQAWNEGEECDPFTGVPHLAYALASLAIIVDARAAGKFVDDRPIQGGYKTVIDDLAPLIGKLKELYRDRPEPKHYTIADNT